jgi:hypothetical protein
MIVTLASDILLALALLTTLLATWAASKPSGPEGPVGAWLLFLPPLGLAAVALFLMMFRNRLDWIPGGALVRFLAILGVLTTFAMAMIVSMDKQNTLLSIAGKVAPFLILIGCALAVHARQFALPWVAGILFAVAAVSGWSLWGFGLVSKIRSDMRQAEEAAAEEAKRESEYEAQEVAEFRALPADAALSAVMRYTWSRNATVSNEARARVNAWPGLEDAMIELLNQDNDTVVTYVSHVMQKPPARLAPAWGAMMERQLKNWDVLQHDEYAGKWEPNLSAYFEGARKIQESGGDLKPQLTAWHTFLRKCKGLDNLAAYVGTLIRK